MSLSLQKTLRMAIFYGTFRGALGFDVAMFNTKDSCDNKPAGLNGWIMKGQVFAYAGVEVGMDVSFGFIKNKKIPIMRCDLGAMLKGQLPNPTILNGQLAGSYSVLGGMVSGKFNLKFRVASQKDLDCLKAKLANPNAALADLPVIADKYPNQDENKDVPIFANPKLAYNMSVGNEMMIVEQDEFSTDITRYIKPVLDPTAGFIFEKRQHDHPVRNGGRNQKYHPETPANAGAADRLYHQLEGEMAGENQRGVEGHDGQGHG